MREKRPGNRIASGKFFYLVEHVDRFDEKVNRRIDALDEKLTGKIESEVKAINERIDKLDTKLTSKLENLSDKFTATQQWMIGLIVAMVLGSGAIIITLLHH